MSGRPNSKSSLHILLKALIPYTRENLQLSFHPNAFFNELERQSGYRQKTFHNAAWKAEKAGLIKKEGKLLKLTAKGLEELKPFEPTKLPGKVRLMVIFDIPEEEARSRRRLRLLLREWRFIQEQKSVWVSDFDSRKVLIEAIKEMGLEKYVQVFESAKLYPK